MNTFEEKKEKLHTLIKQGGKPAIAYSGGVDSSLLLWLCSQLRNGDALGILVTSPAQSDSETKKALALAREHNLKVEVATADILTIDAVAHNNRDRCYHCKKMILQKVKEIALKNNCSVIYDGSNADDTKEYRPGTQALLEENVQSPLKESGFTKSNIRNYACDLELSNWQKPPSPCLLTRFPYEMKAKITPEVIKNIEKGEVVLDFLCQHNYRLRWEGENWVRIEASKNDMKIILEGREALTAALEKLGFTKVTLDLRPFKSGSFDRE